MMTLDERIGKLADAIGCSPNLITTELLAGRTVKDTPGLHQLFDHELETILIMILKSRRKVVR